jgi:glycine/D-amino acid oxidase-like deaminating enzyme
VAAVAGDRTVEVAVIGGGYTGLSAAYRLAGDHGVETVVLEAHRVGWGASGRNGGFAMIGMGKLGLQERIDRWGLEAARRSHQLSVQALESVRELISKEQIDCDPQEDGWINVAHRPRRVHALRERQALSRERLGHTDLEFLDRAALDSGGYLRGPSAHAALRCQHAFGLHPLKYAHGLAAAALRRGATVCERSPVVSWSTAGGWHLLATPGGTVRARRVAVATNGYTPEDLQPFFAGRALAATSNIIVTRPLSDAEWDTLGMTTTEVYTDTRHLVFYWRRLPDNRLLFGGRAGLIDTASALRRRRVWLEARMVAKFPDLAGIGSESFWHGKVCLPYDRTPHVHAVADDPTVVYALGYTGTGVSLATHCGGLAADLAVGRDLPRDTPLTAAGLPRFPLAALRRLYLAGAYALYGVKDRWL